MTTLSSPRTTRMALAFAALLAAGASLATPAAAQYNPRFAGAYNADTYDQWQRGWDHDRYDRRHVELGTVANFQPYRLDLRRPSGFVQQIDLKNGTVIVPRGGTPQPNQHVAVIGYFSNGTFIANRLILRNY